MGPIKSPGAVALGASVVDQLGRQVNPETNRQPQLPQAATRTAGGAGDRAVVAVSSAGAQQRPAFRASEQRSADLLAVREFHLITKFAAACRRQWPGAIIVLRPDGARAGAPPNPETSTGEDHD